MSMSKTNQFDEGHRCFKEKGRSIALCSLALCFLLVPGAPSAEELTITAIQSRVKIRHLCSLFF
jgi:hypothetical protein